MLVRARRRRGVGTPDLAEQAGVLPDCQRQYDREQRCSKHVDARDLQPQELRQSRKGATAQDPWFSRARRDRARRPAEFRRRVPKIPHRNRCVQRPKCVLPWLAGGTAYVVTAYLAGRCRQPPHRRWKSWASIRWKLLRLRIECEDLRSCCALRAAPTHRRSSDHPRHAWAVEADPIVSVAHL